MPQDIAPDVHSRTPSESLVRSASQVSIAVFLSRLTGVVREMIMARLFGAGAVYDAFLLGFRMPNLTRDLFAEGALSSAFVPTFTVTLAKKGRKEAALLSDLTATAVILLVGALSLLGVVFAPVLVELLAPGFHQVPGKFELAVKMTRIMFPFLLLVALAAQAMGVLNACNRFGVPAMASTFFNLGAVGFGLLAGFVIGPRVGIDRITGMAIGVVLGGLLQLLWQMPSMSRLGFGYRPAIDWSHPGLRQIIRLMGPAIVGSAAVQINVMVNTNFASRIPMNGPVSWLAYAFRFMQLPLGIFGVAIASATLPAISRSAAAGRMDEYRRTLSRSLTLVFLLTVPSSVGLILLGKAMIGVIYEGGQFTASDTAQTAVALSCYAFGLAGYSALKVVGPAFYALHDARTPMYVSICSILVNYFAASAMSARFGFAGLAATTSIVALFGAVALFWILRNRTAGIYGRELAATLGKIILAAAVMGLATWASSSLMGSRFGFSRVARLADLAVSIPVGAGVFYALCRALRVKELAVLRNAVFSPVAR